MKYIEAARRLFRRRGWGRKQKPEPANGSMEKFIQMIENTRDEEYSCDEIYELIDQFAEMITRGEDVRQLMPLVQHHIEMCADCREELEALLRVMNATLA